LLVTDTERVLEHARTSLGPTESWPRHPGGWPDEVEAALIDAVLSANARYGSETTGVRAAVRRWRDAQDDRSLDSLPALLEWVDRNGAGPFTEVLNTWQLVPGRGDRPLKSEAIIQVASVLTKGGMTGASDVRPDEHGPAFTSVRGVGSITWRYFLMLLGIPGVKADRMIVRFVADALGLPPRAVSSKQAQSLLEDVSGRLNVTATQLDHAAWSYQRGQ